MDMDLDTDTARVSLMPCDWLHTNLGLSILLTDKSG